MTDSRLRSAGTRSGLGAGCKAAAMLALALGSFACASTPDPISITPASALANEFEDAPDWVMRSCAAYWGDDDGARICGVGSMGGTRNVSLARATAAARGRTEIARTLQVKVRSMLKDYEATTTGGEEYLVAAADEQHVVDVSRQITDFTLSGTEANESWISPNGTLYTLMVLDLEKFQNSVSQMSNLNESVRRAVEDRAEEAFRELDDLTEFRYDD